MGRLLFFILGLGVAIYFGSSMLFGTALSEGDIEDLFEQQAELQNQLISDRTAMVNFVAYTMDPNFQFTTIYTVTMPGSQPQNMNAVMDKKKYGEYLFNSMAGMSHYSYSNDIKDIAIKDSGREAVVSYTMTSTAAGPQSPDIAINADCTSEVYLHPSGTLKIKTIQCKGNMQLTPNKAAPPAPPPPPAQ